MENNQQGLYDERRDELTHYHAVGFRNLDISQNTQAQEAQPRGVERPGLLTLTLVPRLFLGFEGGSRIQQASHFARFETSIWT